MEALHSTIAQKFHVSEAVQDAVVWNSGAGEALQNMLVQISGVDEALQTRQHRTFMLLKHYRIYNTTSHSPGAC